MYYKVGEIITTKRKTRFGKRFAVIDKEYTWGDHDLVILQSLDSSNWTKVQAYPYGRTGLEFSGFSKRTGKRHNDKACVVHKRFHYDVTQRSVVCRHIAA